MNGGIYKSLISLSFITVLFDKGQLFPKKILSVGYGPDKRDLRTDEGK